MKMNMNEARVKQYMLSMSFKARTVLKSGPLQHCAVSKEIQQGYVLPIFRLRLTAHGRSYADNICLRKTLKNLKLMFTDRKFSGEYPILISHFFPRLGKEADTLEISKGHSLQPHLLAGSATEQYRAEQNGSRFASVN